MAKDKKYEKMVLEINNLNEELRKSPQDQKLKEAIAIKEEELMQYVMSSSKELEEYMRNERENNLYGDEHPH